MTEESVNRREFAKKLAVGSATVPFATNLAKAADEADDMKKAEQADAEPEAEKPVSETDLLLEVIKQRYPNENLTDEILRHVGASISGKIGRGNYLSNFPLKNADEPGFVFSAYRSDG